ncbi:MAG: hypothetical protein ABSH32_07495 [Bryobacteraceae bacterium]
MREARRADRNAASACWTIQGCKLLRGCARLLAELDGRTRGKTSGAAQHAIHQLVDFIAESVELLAEAVHPFAELFDPFFAQQLSGRQSIHLQLNAFVQFLPPLALISGFLNSKAHCPA